MNSYLALCKAVVKRDSVNPACRLVCDTVACMPDKGLLCPASLRRKAVPEGNTNGRAAALLLQITK
ncbi:hypothetical protein A8C56_11710 [Niabella ginsenosidivorans]|uniref:Uncharacterized protein n=1 Tax=Niabella ginsenosidivorans TaxID=1176587 RepID=A0A1A9I4C0_9BACT|nr:hypothetical protein A8C56_11710 [Niabella ginsenosidivorans]